jgi:hypothetical protein
MPLEINKSYLVIQLIFLSFILNAQPKANISASSQVRIGMNATVYIQVTNCNFTGPSRITINVPKGWELEKYPGEMASVSQTNNQVRIVWFEFPQKDTVDVVFMLQLPKTQEKGKFPINGWMDYTDNGKLKRFEISDHTFRVVKYYTRIQ